MGNMVKINGKEYNVYLENSTNDIVLACREGGDYTMTRIGLPISYDLFARYSRAFNGHEEMVTYLANLTSEEWELLKISDILYGEGGV
jgi:hypothetical protein